MKKVFTLATAALLITGFAFAHDGGKKKDSKDCTKECCKGKECRKDTKETAKETKSAVKATKKA